MKISLVYFSPYPSKRGHSASDRRVRDFVRGLSFAGHTLDLLIPKYHYKNIDESHPYEFNIKYLGLKLKHFPLLLKRIFFLIHLYNYVLKSKTQCVFFYNAQFDSIFIIKLLRIKKIIIVNEICDLHSDSTTPSFKTRLAKYTEKFFSKNTDLFITISNYLKKSILKMNPNSNIITIPILVDTDVFKPIENNSIGNNKDFVIMYAGNMWKHQGVSDLIQAFSLLIKENIKARLVIAGSYTTNANCDDIQSIINELNLNNFVDLPGWINTTQLVTRLNQADLLVIPQKKQNFTLAGFPTKLAEYAACAKPILITKVGDICDYFEHGNNCYLCESDNVNDMFITLKKIIENPELNKEIAQKAYLLANSVFSYKSNGKIISDHLNQLKQKQDNNKKQFA